MHVHNINCGEKIGVLIKSPTTADDKSTCESFKFSIITALSPYNTMFEDSVISPANNTVLKHSVIRT